MNKKGISPYIATILLIGFVVAIILIITLWGRNLVEERAEKEGATSQAQLQCGSVDIQVEKVSNGVLARNTGTLKFEGFTVREDIAGGFTRVSNVYTTVDVGESFTFVQSGSPCPENEPSAPGALCSNSGSAIICPGKQPEGRGAPLINCPDKCVTVRG